MPRLYTITPRRLAANRENAQRSTGPRTDDGKRRASANSLHHHAFAAHLLHPGEDARNFHLLRNSILADLAPQGTLELCLADRVVSAAWRLRRLQHADRCLTEMQQVDWRAQLEAYNDRLEDRREEFLANNKRFNLHRNPDGIETDDDTLCRDAGLPDLLPVPDGHATADDDPPMPAPGSFLAQSLRADATPNPGAAAAPTSRAPRTTPFERLLAAELRLQGMMARALRDLRQLRLDRRDPDKAPDDFTPFAIHDGLPDDDVADDDAPDPKAPENLSTDNPPPPSPEGDSNPRPPINANAAGEGGGEGRATGKWNSPNVASAPPSVTSVCSVSSVLNSPMLQNEPTCQSGSSPAALLARASEFAARSLNPGRKEHPRR